MLIFYLFNYCKNFFKTIKCTLLLSVIIFSIFYSGSIITVSYGGNWEVLTASGHILIGNSDIFYLCWHISIDFRIPWIFSQTRYQIFNILYDKFLLKALTALWYGWFLWRWLIEEMFLDEIWNKGYTKISALNGLLLHFLYIIFVSVAISKIYAIAICDLINNHKMFCFFLFSLPLRFSGPYSQRMFFAFISLYLPNCPTAEHFFPKMYRLPWGQFYWEYKFDFAFTWLLWFILLPLKSATTKENYTALEWLKTTMLIVAFYPLWILF